MIRLETVLFKDEAITDWLKYFDYNRTHLLKLNFYEGEKLTANEKLLISPSIRAFQIGEGSSGNNFIKLAKEYADNTGDFQYIEEVHAFIGEENRHSKTLGYFMEVNGISPVKSSGLDRCFRFLRKRFSLKWEIIVLVTAEMIALSYYTVLSKVTESTLLKEICRQMLRDELRHVIFQSQMLKKLKLNRWDQLIRKVLMLITANIVWLCFRRIFKQGEFNYQKFICECFGYLRQSGEIALAKS